MAPNHILVQIVSLLVALAPVMRAAQPFIVGDSLGWTTGVNYQAWVASKDFRVGDTLIFRYKPNTENVYEVNAEQYETCTVPPGGTLLTTGNDGVFLTTPGSKWFIGGIADHCHQGQKLSIFVTEPDQ